MTYKLKYYWQNTDNGIQLNIYENVEDDQSVTSRYIGDLCALRLGLDGGDNEYDAPIIKTALQFSIVDSWDKESTNSVKYGNWEEFYTPSSTKYKVTLSRISNGSVLWSGFIMSDFWEETLTYRGIITVTAKDNLGIIDSIDCSQYDIESEDGLVSVWSYIQQALSRCPLAGTLERYGADESQLVRWGTKLISASNNDDIFDCLVNVEFFDDKTWAEGLEALLSSFGLILRYGTNNKWYVCHLRDWLELCGHFTGLTAEPIFIADGTRSINPCTRKIIDEVEFETGTIFHDRMRAADYKEHHHADTINGGIIYEYWEANEDTSPWKNASYNVTDPIFEPGYPTRYFMYIMPNSGLSFSQYIDGYKEEDTMYICAYKSPYVDSITLDPYLMHKLKNFTPGKQLKFSCKVGQDLIFHDKTTSSSYYDRVLPKNIIFRYGIKGTKNGQNVWFNPYKVGKPVTSTSGQRTGLSDGWDTSLYIITQNVYGSLQVDSSGNYLQSLISGSTTTKEANESIEQSFSTYGVTDIEIRIYAATLHYDSSTTVVSPKEPRFLRTYEMNLTLADEANEVSKITTVNDEEYNVDLKRSPAFGEMHYTPTTPNAVINGLYGTDFKPSLNWRWNDSMSTSAEPLAAKIHRELLCWSIRAEDSLNGDFFVQSSLLNWWPFITVFTYAERKHIMVGGTLNLLTNQVEGGILREVIGYEDLWQVAVLTNVSYTGSGTFNARSIYMHAKVVLQRMGMDVPFSGTAFENLYNGTVSSVETTASMEEMEIVNSVFNEADVYFTWTGKETNSGSVVSTNNNSKKNNPYIRA